MVTKGHEAQPGPNTYNIPSKVGEGPKSHMHARTDTVDMNKKLNIPGPGSYDVAEKTNGNIPKAAAFSMGSGNRMEIGGGKESKFKPGPGNYHTDKDLKASAPKYGFGSSQRPAQGQSDKNKTPAPGDYQIKGLIGNDGVSKSMSPKLVDRYAEKQAKQLPGPGQYESHTKNMKAAPSYGMGSEQRTQPGVNLKNATPDPGAYNPSHEFSKSKAPGYKIGTENRDAFDTKKHANMPGPGNYELQNGAFRKKPQFYMGIKLGE